MAWFTRPGIGIAFENRFFLKELMKEYLGLILPLKSGTIGLVVYRYGNQQYNELKTGMAFSRKFGKTFSAAIQIDYLHTRIEGISSSLNLFSCEIGLMYNPDKHLRIGVHLVNPVPIRITRNPDESLPVILVAGLCYKFSENLIMTTEIEKDLENPLIFRLGGEYHLGRTFSVRIGCSTGPFVFTFGFGLEFGRFRLDIASAYEQELGFSPSGSLIYEFGKIKSLKAGE